MLTLVIPLIINTSIYNLYILLSTYHLCTINGNIGNLAENIKLVCD